MKKLALCCLALAPLLLVPPVHGAVEYSNLGPNNGFIGNTGTIVSGSAYSNGAYSPADPFKASFTGMLTSVEVAIFKTGAAAPITLNLYRNNPLTNLPSTTLGFTTLGTVIPTTDSQTSIQTATLAGSNVPVLLAGQTYWLELDLGATSVYSGWAFAQNLPQSASAFSADNGASFQATTQYPSAFRVNAVAIPEPSTWVLPGLGSAGLLGLTLRRRRLVQGRGAT